MPVTALPTPPSRNDPTNFATRADSFLGALPTFASELNTVQTDVNAAQAAATAAANTANAAANSAVQASNVSQWVSGTTYTTGQVVWSPANFQTYRRRTNGAGTTDPSSDATNWEPLTISSTSGVTLNNNVSYKSRLSGGTVFDLLNINPSNLTYLFGSAGMQLVVNGTPRFAIDGSGRVGIGTTSPGATFEIVGTQNILRRFDTGASGYTTSVVKGRGTLGAPSTVLNGDAIGVYNFFAHDGTGERPAAAIACFVDGVPANGTVPSMFEFSTTPVGTNQTPQPRIVIKADGSVGVGTSSPARRLHTVVTAPAGSSENTATPLMLSNTSSDGTSGTPNIVSLQFGDAAFTSRGSLQFGVAGLFYSRITVNGTVVMHAAADGKIGFGTTAPTRALHISYNDPEILLEEKDQGTDAKKWLTNVTASQYRLSTLNDAETVAQTAYTATRSGNNVTGHEWSVGGGIVFDILSTGVVRYSGIEIGFRNIPRVTGGLEAGKCLATTAGFTLNTGAAAGTAYSVYNDSASAITITQGAGLTLRLAGSTTTGNRTIAPRGMATIWFNSTTEAIVSGAGVT